MYYVYLLRSDAMPSHRYIGFTNDVGRRLAEHNSGKSNATRFGAPWRVVTVIGFDSRDRALAFERYLKSGSGRAFANKRLW